MMLAQDSLGSTTLAIVAAAGLIAAIVVGLMALRNRK